MFRVANTPARTCLFSLLEHLSCFSRLAVKLSHPFLRCQRTKVGKQLGSDLHLDGVTIPAGFRENTPLGKHAVALRWRDTKGQSTARGKNWQRHSRGQRKDGGVLPSARELGSEREKNYTWERVRPT